MAGKEIVEFAIFPASSADPQSFLQERTAAASKADGLVRQYVGIKLEDHKAAVHVTVWRSAAARAAFAASASSGPKPLLVEPFEADDIDRFLAALDGPCTEVFTGYGAVVDGSFLKSVRTFRDRVSAPTPAKATSKLPAGFHVAAVAQTSENLVAPAPAVGPAVRLAIGWSSREAHLAAKAEEGPIADNIGLLRDGREAADLYHVHLHKV